MINKETFILGQKIRYFRNRMNLSQMDLGVSTGLSFGTISRIKNGTINPNKETIEKILDSLHISLIERSYV